MAKYPVIESRHLIGRWLINRIDMLPLCRDLCRRWIIGFSWVGLVGVVLHEYARLGRSVFGWDLLLISGLTMFIIGVWWAGRAPARFRLCLARLHDRGAIRLQEKPLDALIDELEEQADRWARVVAVVIALAMFAALAIVLWTEFWPPRALLGVIEAATGYIAGGYLGRMIFYGQLGWLLRKRRVAVIVDPWHADQVAGLKPIGDFFFMQAIVIAVPAAFFAAWLLLIPVWPRNYGHWQEPYLGLLSIAVVIQALAFLWPLWSFHAVMVEEKNRWRSDVDRLYRRHAANRRALLEPSTPEAKKALKEALDIVEDQYIAVQGMPTWPVDFRLRLRFALNNVILLLPLVTDLLREELDWPPSSQNCWPRLLDGRCMDYPALIGSPRGSPQTTPGASPL